MQIYLFLPWYITGLFHTLLYITGSQRVVLGVYGNPQTEKDYGVKTIFIKNAKSLFFLLSFLHECTVVISRGYMTYPQ